MATKTEKKVHKQLISGKVLKDLVNIVYQETTLVETIDEETKAVMGTDKFITTHDVTSRFSPHMDLINALKMFRKPAIDILETKDYGTFESYTIRGITLKGMDSEEDPRVIIHGSKKLEHNPKPWNFVTPSCTIRDEQKYADAAKLDGFCADAQREFFAYLDGKHAASPQMKIEFEDNTSMNIDVKEDVKPEKKSKKKEKVSPAPEVEVEAPAEVSNGMDNVHNDLPFNDGPAEE